MRRTTATLAAAALVLAGCGPTFDADGYALVGDYVDAQIGATEIATSATDLGDQQQREEAADRIDEVNATYWGRNDWPAYDEIEDWQINMTQADREWQVTGDELAPAVSGLEDTSGWLAEQLRGDDDQELQWAIEDAQAAVDKVRTALTGR